MPTAPYAKVLVSIDGAANTSGGIDVSAGAVVAFSAESTVGWRQQRWEIYDYPEGWTTPTGWTKADDGTIYSTAVTPTSITMPADLWGAWGVRLTVNDGIDVDPTLAPGLIDEATALMVLSPKGQRALMALEADQFCTPETKIKQWVRTVQRNQEALEEKLDVPTIAGDADGILTVTAGTVTNTSDAKLQPISTRGHLSTEDATETSVDLMETPADHDLYDVTVMVTGRDSSGHGAIFASWILRAGYMTDGFLNATSTPNPATDENPVKTTGANDLNAKLTSGSSGLRLKVTGLAETTITWGWELYARKLNA